jgi:hypothetical protein
MADPLLFSIFTESEELLIFLTNCKLALEEDLVLMLKLVLGLEFAWFKFSSI